MNELFVDIPTSGAKRTIKFTIVSPSNIHFIREYQAVNNFSKIFDVVEFSLQLALRVLGVMKSALSITQSDLCIHHMNEHLLDFKADIVHINLCGV